MVFNGENIIVEEYVLPLILRGLSKTQSVLLSNGEPSFIHSRVTFGFVGDGGFRVMSQVTDLSVPFVKFSELSALITTVGVGTTLTN